MEVQLFPAPFKFGIVVFMQGISGIISARIGNELEPCVRRMTERLVHEKNQRTNVLVDNRLGVGVGWMQQVDGKNKTALGCCRSRDTCVIACGEHFSDIANYAGTEQADPTAYLLQQYEAKGSQAFECLNGWFCGVVLDFRMMKIILFTDRYGLGRIYLHENASGFFFATQAKSILEVAPEARQLDPIGMGEWFTCGCVLQNRTLFRNVYLLPAGSAWTFQDGTIDKRYYFKPQDWEDQSKLDEETYSRRLQQTFAKILPRYLQEDQSIGMSLTAGLDGRMIMALWPKGPGELPCYTFNGPYRNCVDARIAQQIARTVGQPHKRISVGEEFISAFPVLAERSLYLTDGSMDVTGAAELYVNRRAREIASVRLTGNYGSEILRSNVAFKPKPLSDYLFDTGFLPHTQNAARTYGEEAKGNRRSFIAFKQIPWHHFGRFAAEQSELPVRSPFLDNDLVALAFQAPTSLETSMEPSLRLIGSANPLLGRIPTDRGIIYPGNRVANRVRCWMENLMARAEYAYDYGMPQWLARIDHVLAPLKMEHLFLGRQKFCHFRVWYRDQLASYVKETLLDPRSLSRPYLNRHTVEGMVTEHLRGRSNFTTEIHKLLSMELLHRCLIDKP